MPTWTQPHSFDPGDDPEMDQPEGPSDAEMLDTLDGYGHLTWAVGETYPDDPDAESTITIAPDFTVFIHPDHPKGDILIAYHVVYDDDVGGFIDTVEEGVFSADDLGDLDTNAWFPVENSVDAANENLAESGGFIHWDTVEAMQKKWTAELVKQVKRAIAHLDSGEEIPFSATLMED